MKPKNETISDPAKTVVITCNDNSTGQTPILRFPYRAQKDTSADFQQSIVTALQLLYSTVLNGKNDLMTDSKRERIQKQTFPE